ncbi:MAG: hypothetical protein E7228_03905 [Clostridiales bacterium]|nr:hypothetical protein [Clostridiales bacterium]
MNLRRTTLKKTDKFLIEELNIDPKILSYINEAEKQLEEQFKTLDDVTEFNQYKVLGALQKNRVSDKHFSWNTGYGYNDAGRETTEQVFADLFKTEDAIVRPIIVNGTHALSLTLTGILRPGDEIIYCTGKPYDTLEQVIGIKGKAGDGSLKDFGVVYKQVELKPDGTIDLEALGKTITEKTKMVCMQRATGYGWRKSMSVDEMGECCSFVKSINPDIIMMADNCYGEFLDVKEPTEVGVDVMAGSLIKNPGGGLALTGGYIAGRADLIKLISYRLTTVGIGKECGLTFGQTRTMLQGLFMAPKVVNGALKGAMLCAKVFENLGFDVCPGSEDVRSDIIQCVKLGTAEGMIAFCEGIQAAAPVDAYVTPVPWDMPGYDDPVIMAAGAFVQGSSIELSADGPVREPYIVYFQGGLTYEYSKIGVIKGLQAMLEKGLL